MKRKIILFTFVGMLALWPAYAVRALEDGAGQNMPIAAGQTRPAPAGTTRPQALPGAINTDGPNRVPEAPAGTSRPQTLPGTVNSDGPNRVPEAPAGTSRPQTLPGAVNSKGTNRLPEAPAGTSRPQTLPGAVNSKGPNRVPEAPRNPAAAGSPGRDAVNRFILSGIAKQRPRAWDDTGRRRALLKAAEIPGVIDIFNVKPGDTMWEISRKYKVRLEAVIDANPTLREPDLIYPGDQIMVPLSETIDDNMDIGGAKYYGGVDRPRPYPYSRPAVPNGSSWPGDMESEIFALVNKEREKAGAPPLAWSAALGNAARAKSLDMSENGYFSHNSGIYGSPFDMMKTFGVSYNTAGENIAKGQKTAAAVMTAWMASPGHKKNILNPRFTEIGVGYSMANNGTTYWAQQFIGR